MKIVPINPDYGHLRAAQEECAPAASPAPFDACEREPVDEASYLYGSRHQPMSKNQQDAWCLYGQRTLTRLGVPDAVGLPSAWVHWAVVKDGHTDKLEVARRQMRHLILDVPQDQATRSSGSSCIWRQASRLCPEADFWRVAYPYHAVPTLDLGRKMLSPQQEAMCSYYLADRLRYVSGLVKDPLTPFVAAVVCVPYAIRSWGSEEVVGIWHIHKPPTAADVHRQVPLQATFIASFRPKPRPRAIAYLRLVADGDCLEVVVGRPKTRPVDIYRLNLVDGLHKLPHAAHSREHASYLDPLHAPDLAPPWPA